MTESDRGSALEVFRTALKLGLTSFGGPIAHLGYFRDEYVVKKKWIDEESYADIVGFSSSIPGPTSSQVGIIVGTHRAGLLGGFAAWLGFTLPSAVALIVFGYVVRLYSFTSVGWLNGLKIAAVVIVAQAVLGMGTKLAPDIRRATLAVGAAIAALALYDIPIGQLTIILVAGIIGYFLLRDKNKNPPTNDNLNHETEQKKTATRISIASNIPRNLGILSLGIFFVAVLTLPILQALFPSNHWIELFNGFFRSGALVFGGGHVVLPLLNAVVVPPGWVTNSQFLAGYGFAQAVPGPLFTFAAYLGTVEAPIPNGVVGGVLALVAIFAPSFLLIYGVLPFWDTLRKKKSFQSVLAGINAAVVGILLAALYNPIFVTSVLNFPDFALVLITGLMLFVWKRPPWNVVLVAAVGGLIIGMI